MSSRRTFLRCLAASVLCRAAVADPAAAQDTGPVVFAAASLKNAVDEINAAWTAETGKKAIVSYAASSALAKQIEAGAPADLFASADLAWMDYLAEKQLIKDDTCERLLGNDLVLVAPAGLTAAPKIEPGFALKSLLNGGKLAMGAVAAVPAGKYGKAALESLGVWKDVEADVAQADNVRAALLLVSRGEAPLGIVYKTDAASDPSVKIVGTFPAGSHPPIVYPVALTTGSKNPDAAAFQAYLRSEKARAVFERQGFDVLASQ